MSHPNSPSKFVDQVVKFYNANLKSRSRADGEEPRVIIRCDRMDSIRQISKVLSDKGLSNVAIHENFRDDWLDAPNEHHSVPDPDTTPATYWIHQFKLLEGIDDPRFQLLALYDELKTVKAFVQQVGRVLRNPKRNAGSIAYVLDHSNGRQEYLWSNFLAYDEVIAAAGIRSLAVGNEALLRILEQSSPSLTYIDGIFRFPCKLGKLNPDDLQLPRTVNIVSKGESFRLRDFFVMLTRSYQQEDRIVQTLPPDKHGLAVVFYVCFSNSPFLREKYFVESKLGVTILWETDRYLCYFDSLGRLLSHETLDGPVTAATLRRLFQRRNDLYLTSVALWNANPGLRSFVHDRCLQSRSVLPRRLSTTTNLCVVSPKDTPHHQATTAPNHESDGTWASVMEELVILLADG